MLRQTTQVQKILGQDRAQITPTVTPSTRVTNEKAKTEANSRNPIETQRAMSMGTKPQKVEKGKGSGSSRYADRLRAKIDNGIDCRYLASSSGQELHLA
jgi:hypothetical protein